MVTASVSIRFEAASVDEAQAKIAEWNLPEDRSILINITESTNTLVVNTPEVPDEQNG